MKKLTALLLALMMALPGLALADATDGDAALMELAGDMTDRMIDACLTEGYAYLYSGSEEVSGLIADALAFSYNVPCRTAVIAISHPGMDAALRGISVGTLGKASEDSMELIRLRSFAALPSLLNARQGVNWLAAVSIMGVSDVVQLDGVEPGIYYVISAFPAEQPLTCASIYVKDNGLALCSVSPLKLDDEARDALLSSGDEWVNALPYEWAGNLEGQVRYALYVIEDA